MNKSKTEQLSVILKQELGVHGNNCKTVIDFICALQKARTVNLSKMSNYSNKVSKVNSQSIYKSYQRLIHNCKIGQDDLAKCIIKMYGFEHCKLTLSMDRTNWRYGKSDINLLVLSVCVLDCAIPLYWIELDKRGNSNTKERIDLLDMFIQNFGVDAIEYLVADREFIGIEWIDYLNVNKINFAIRIKSNMILEVNGKSIKANKLFSSVGISGLVSHQCKIEGYTLLAQATRSIDNELVIVVSNNLQEPNLLAIYAKRWRIECLFSNCKTRGFNFEDTHITSSYRIGNLTKLIVLAFAICYLIGLVRASIKPLTIKKHGYKQTSYFRYGYDLLIQKLNQNFCSAIRLITLCMSDFELEVKCKKLISVM